MSRVFGITPAAVGARLALDAALDRLAEDGRLTPCQADPNAWTSENYRDRQAAIEACAFCPVRSPCGVFAKANKEPAAVWGGIDHQLTTREKNS